MFFLLSLLNLRRYCFASTPYCERIICMMLNDVNTNAFAKLFFTFSTLHQKNIKHHIVLCMLCKTFKRIFKAILYFFFFFFAYKHIDNSQKSTDFRIIISIKALVLVQPYLLRSQAVYLCQRIIYSMDGLIYNSIFQGYKHLRHNYF